LGEAKCKKCIEDGKAIKSTTSGSCAVLTSICSANEIFIRVASGLSDNSNHLGSCEATTICATIDYSTNRGFETIALGEAKCKKCIEDGKAIKSTTSGSCTALTSICSANEIFIRAVADDSNHLGSCEATTICATIDYSSNRGF